MALLGNHLRNGVRIIAAATIVLFGLFLNTHEINSVKNAAGQAMMTWKPSGDNHTTNSTSVDRVASRQPPFKNTTIYDLQYNLSNVNSCFRKCHGYPNRIVVPDRQIPAGLGDRSIIIRELGNLAAYLCAKLIIPEPRVWLTARHNRGRRAPGKLVWERDLVWAEHLPTHTLAASSDPQALIPIPPNVTIWKLGGMYQTNTDNLTLDFGRVEAFTEQQQQQQQAGTHLQRIFEWEIDWFFHQYWPQLRAFMVRNVQWQNPTPKDRSLPISHCPLDVCDKDPVRLEGCQYIQLHPPKFILETARRIQDNLTRTFSTNRYGYLHLRRGDTKQVCDTSPPKVQDYLNCTLARHAAIRGMPLLVATDEKRTDYRSSIQTIVETTLNMVYVDLDQAVRTAIQHRINTGEAGKFMMNEFVIFRVAQEVGANAAFQLERRRHYNCRDCDADLIPSFLTRQPQQRRP